jgi:His-Xaa-Ser system protein HxsD
MAHFPERDQSDRRHSTQEEPEIAPLDAFQNAPLRSERSLYVTLPREVYALKALLAAAYKFSSDYAVWVDTVDAHRWAVVFVAPQTINHGEVFALFSKELIDQQLRVGLEKEFGSLRTLIVAQAFSEGNLLNAGSEPDQ